MYKIIIVSGVKRLGKTPILVENEVNLPAIKRIVSNFFSTPDIMRFLILNTFCLDSIKLELVRIYEALNKEITFLYLNCKSKY